MSEPKYTVRFFKNRASFPDLAEEAKIRLDIDELWDVLSDTNFDEWFRVCVTRVGV